MCTDSICLLMSGWALVLGEQLDHGVVTCQRLMSTYCGDFIFLDHECGLRSIFEQPDIYT
jgi:hypothetical protein